MTLVQQFEHFNQSNDQYAHYPLKMFFGSRSWSRAICLIALSLFALNLVLVSSYPVYTEKLLKSINNLNNLNKESSSDDIMSQLSFNINVMDIVLSKCKPSAEIDALCKQCQMQTHNPLTYVYCCLDAEDSRNFCKSFVDFEFLQMPDRSR